MTTHMNTSSSSMPGTASAINSHKLTNSDGQPVTLTGFFPCLLVVLQCALLHPTFVRSRLARTIRGGITPFSVAWAIMFPFRYCFRPLESSAQQNMGVASFGIYTALKSIEWGFASGPYYKRPLKTVNGVRRWEKVKDTDDSYKKEQEDEPRTAFRLITWTLLQLFSIRGLQWTWGPAMDANTRSNSNLVGRILRLTVPMTCALALIILTRDSPQGTPTSGLTSIGVPNFPGLKLLAESAYTTSFGVYLSCTMDVSWTFVMLLFAQLHKIARYFQFSEPILELCDPVYFPPMFNSPHQVDSLADFWGKAWHSVLKRIFLQGGGKPAVWITKKLGASPKIQKVAGLFGVFAVSAFLHEYLVHVFAQAPHPSRDTFISFPGSGIFFIIQPIAMLIEPIIIPMIPKSIGGGRLWVWAFLIASSYTFRAQYLAKGGIIDHFLPLSQWSWLFILSPIKT